MHNLSRFHVAQERQYSDALNELKGGRKRSHWMWFIFPQIRGLGASSTSIHFALSDLAEAQEYLRDSILGARLRECVTAVLEHKNTSPYEIFGSPDDLKFCSCLTLFERADPSEELFSEALNTFYEGVRDAKTIELINSD